MRAWRIALIAASVCVALADDPETSPDDEEVDENGKTRKDIAGQYAYCLEDNCYGAPPPPPACAPRPCPRPPGA